MILKNRKREIVFHDLNKLFIVVDGFKYGADFVLYKNNVDEEHGFALVFIKEENICLNEKEKNIIVRICESVKKKAIIAYINEENKSIRYEEVFRKRK
ncbi:tRNA-intron endonuclease [Plasmodium falciparum Santa Lucia]|uniref:tRNA-intron lyase n=8 Tax=Plasmodium falciparum TaxID=5833 RepID=Q8I718_PLAF7|nr:tRNA intron endonuclease, putative [Plasmodium falciparum 3D7]ETW15927.1 tRNA-intron endonuclease [Plasmodium falciparum Vietnam Oak-Knoll (FVO)]ETW33757.1 tRNA-intron endonuclease [Plasmodium falciparum Tanzania (2000708)]ETW39715.1 tRNA-intron endonuclease [Plasmodium falciparum NF135/5.C10]ETW58515.1 tRNA-intron endonuclease [Plasmodium falciparum CAMP/Malaysia]EUT79063.1 tRNA-intron endonuclease [Plasmodium falciparum Santa Lucia]KAF4329555.1 tRNA intron endonuclease [Plasmodium falcip|eukprot:XP_001348688.1 tRNA intron endonuclease, putative [Plasmodium falciparum 3D7]